MAKAKKADEPQEQTEEIRLNTTLFMQKWYARRQRARVDLLYLCNNLLGYQDVCKEVHGPIIEKLQKFSGGMDYCHPETKVFHRYEPKVGLWDLEGPRKRLFLDPRGHLKTTVITIAHTVQWIINYPDVRILLSMATGDQVVKVMTEILGHFRVNEKFRYFFPEFCPPAKSAKDFGNNEYFTVPCRSRTMKEPTVSTCSVGKVIAGSHYEVIKNSDLVDKENVKTPNQINEVISHYKFLAPLLERGGTPPRPGWTDVEGTRYDFADLYGWVLETVERRTEKGQDPEWQVQSRAAITADNKPLWEKRFSMSDFDSMRDDDPFIFSSQYLQNPIPVGSGLASRDELQFAPRKIMRQIPMHIHMTVDLAGMDPQSSGDFTVFNIHGFDKDGRMNVLEILAGRFEVFDVIDSLFRFHKIFPKIQDIKIEREAHSRVLLPFLKREQEKRRTFLPPIIELKRDNRTSKKQRIRALQPWFKAGIIRFADEIDAKLETIQEILRFSETSTAHDDVLDTLADAMQNRDGGVILDVMPDPVKEMSNPFRGREKFMGFEMGTGREIWEGDDISYTYCDPRTGL